MRQLSFAQLAIACILSTRETACDSSIAHSRILAVSCVASVAGGSLFIDVHNLARREVIIMADRRAGPKQGPYVPSPGGGVQPRDRNQDGTWRKKRSDAGKRRKK
jgi:hypothetical protein